MKSSEQHPCWFQYPKFTRNSKKAVVIGAGIAGCQTAYHLTKNHWDVTLIDRQDSIANEASGNPAGVIYPKVTAKNSPGEDFYIHCFNVFLEQVDFLQDQDVDLGWHPRGVLQLAHNAREIKRWQALKEREFSKDFIDLLDEQDASNIAGFPINYKATYFPKGGWINPKTFCKVLTASEKCTTLFNVEVAQLQKNNNLWQVLDTDGNLLAEADVIIFATGKALHQFLPANSKDDFPSLAVAGQTTLAKTSDLSLLLKTVIGHEGYLTPVDLETQRHTFGATFERGIEQSELCDTADKQNLEQLQHYLPEFVNSLGEIESGHAAVRLTTPDRFPYVGALPDTDFYRKHYHDLHLGKHWKDYPSAQYETGIFMLGGFGSRGLTSSAACAKALVELIEGTSQSTTQMTLLQQCHPARYLIKCLKQKTS